MDFSKYLDFSIVSSSNKKTSQNKKKGDTDLFTQIEKGLKDVKKINNKVAKGITVKEMLDEK